MACGAVDNLGGGSREIGLEIGREIGREIGLEIGLEIGREIGISGRGGGRGGLCLGLPWSLRGTTTSSTVWGAECGAQGVGRRVWGAAQSQPCQPQEAEGRRIP